MSRFDAPFEIVKSFGSGGEDECFVGGEFLPVYEDSPASKHFEFINFLFTATTIM